MTKKNWEIFYKSQKRKKTDFTYSKFEYNNSRKNGKLFR